MTARAAVLLLTDIINREIIDAARAHTEGTVPRDPGAHWAWTHERDKRLETLEAMRTHFAAMPPGKEI